MDFYHISLEQILCFFVSEFLQHNPFNFEMHNIEVMYSLKVKVHIKIDINKVYFCFLITKQYYQ